jgi:hypothetical protein
MRRGCNLNGLNPLKKNRKMDEIYSFRRKDEI